MTEFQFGIQQFSEVHTHPDFELFYVLEGETDFCLEGKDYVLGKDDFLIVNSERRHSGTAHGEILYAFLYISYQELAEILKQNVLAFWCNSALEDGEPYDRCRDILRRFFAEQSRGDRRNELHLYSLYYGLLDELVGDFLLTKEDKRYGEEHHKYAERRHEISEYVRLNYDKPISLSALAKKLYLSDAYLSKYIKRQFGVSFLEYVNSVRLNHALTELIYSDKPVVRIALDAGFPSPASFNRVFKKKYGTTPSAYRIQWKGSREKSLNTPKEQAYIKEKLADYLDQRILESS